MNARNIIAVIATAAFMGLLPAGVTAQTETSPAGPPPAPPAPNPAVAAKVRTEYLAWRSGNVVRSHYDDTMKSHITTELLAQVHTGLAQAGDPGSFTLERERTVQGGIRVYDFLVTAAHGAVGVEVGFDTNGLIDGIYFQPLAPRASAQPTS